MNYPKPLRSGSTIAVTAFSAGIEKQHRARFDLVKTHLESLGFRVVLGNCLHGQVKHVSAPLEERVDELMQFLLDDSIDAIFPPWGGEFAMELLPHIDFAKLQSIRPKWVLGFSDVSTLAATFTSKLGWASAHCSNFMDLTPEALDPLTANTLTHIGTPTGETFSQQASTMFASEWPDIANEPVSSFNLDTESSWKWLVKPSSGNELRGRLIGGCWDTLHHLFNTEYLDLETLSENSPEGIILYLENAEMSPTNIVRTVTSMRFKGVFKHISGLLLGRNSAPDPSHKEALTYYEAIEQTLVDCGVPVMYDLDIGHQPPNLTLINGALAKIELDHVGTISQQLV